jgi:hypothetical protein
MELPPTSLKPIYSTWMGFRCLPEPSSLADRGGIMNFTGTWDVVSSPDFYDDYLRMEVAPYVKLRQEGDCVTGEYHLGLQTGDVDGRLEGDDRIVFSFEGMDEMDLVNGAGTATLKGDHLIFKLMYHYGDDFTFECERRR